MWWGIKKEKLKWEKTFRKKVFNCQKEKIRNGMRESKRERERERDKHKGLTNDDCLVNEYFCQSLELNLGIFVWE